MRMLLAATLVTMLPACFQTLNPARLRPEECSATCDRWGMVLTGMVASPHDDACICEVPAAPRQSGAAPAGRSAAGIVVVLAAARAAEESAKAQTPVVVVPH